MKTYLEPSDADRLEQASQYLRDKILIRLVFRLACRISEAVAISVEDIDFERKKVAIPHLKSRVDAICPTCKTRLARSYRWCPGCGSRNEDPELRISEHRRVKSLRLDDKTLEMLREYIERGGAVSRNGQNLILGISPSHAYYIIRECARQASLPYLADPKTGKLRRVSLHKMRDTVQDKVNGKCA